jgi:hypothetical protein
MDNIKENKRTIGMAVTTITIFLATVIVISVTTGNVFALDNKDSIRDTATCDQWFDKLNASQQAAFNNYLSIHGLSREWPSGITTIEQMCKAYNAFTPDQKNFVQTDILGVLAAIKVNQATSFSVMECLNGKTVNSK